MHSKQPSGPSGIPILGSLPFVAWDILPYFERMQALYGNVAQYQLFRTRAYLISSPEHITRIYQGEREGIYTKSYLHEPFKRAFGNGLFNSYSDPWAKQRRQLQPHFQKSSMRMWFPMVLQETRAHLDRFNKRLPFHGDISDVMLPLVQSIITRLLFGDRLAGGDAAKMVNGVQIVSKQISRHVFSYFFLKGFLNRVPTPANKQLDEALSVIQDVLDDISRDKHTVETDCLIAKLRDQMGPSEIRDQLFTLFFAGQDTTVSALLWSLYYLATHPQVAQQLHDEVDAVVTGDTLNWEQLKRLDYLRCVISESLRLAPPAYAWYRNSVEDDILGGYALDKNSIVSMCPYVTHRDPNVWGMDAKQFNPHRFVCDSTKRDAHAYFPFGGGMRTCLGIHLAMMEMTTILALFVARFEFKLLHSPPIKPHTFLTLRPKYGIPLEVVPRRHQH